MAYQDDGQIPRSPGAKKAADALFTGGIVAAPPSGIGKPLLGVDDEKSRSGSHAVRVRRRPISSARPA